MNKPIRYVVVGTGWRAQYYFRLAQWFPDRLEVSGIVCRTQEQATELASVWNVKTFTDVLEATRSTKPDFVALALPWGQIADAIELLVGEGIKVLTETPPTNDPDRMRLLWNNVGQQHAVQVSEQYPWFPDHIASRKVVESGLIGAVEDVHVASTHQYHAFAIMRYLLGEGLEGASITATISQHNVVDPVGGGGWREGREGALAAGIADRSMYGTWSNSAEEKTINLMRAHVTFDSGKTGLYEFWDGQWWNPVRQDRLAIRGSKGEIVDDRVTFLQDVHTTVDARLVRRNTGHGLNLEGQDLDHISVGTEILYTNSWVGQRLSDDEISTADLLEHTGKWARNEEPAPYPLEQHCQDWALSLACDEAAKAGRTIQLSSQPWFEL
jgi:predicted dehydrogenase